jgi:hypothetical protein
MVTTTARATLDVRAAGSRGESEGSTAGDDTHTSAEM